MIFATPRSTAVVRRQLSELDELRSRLGSSGRPPARWLGRLRREFRATDVASSTAIEGFVVPREEVPALLDERRRPDAVDDDRLAVASYGHAMGHVVALADDDAFRWLDRVLLDLHFDACSFHADRRPGRWRRTPIGVTRAGGGLAFEGPPAEQVPRLMDEVVAWLAHDDGSVHPVVRAAMTHLHVVSVHPFEDGNGRIARIAQSLVLAREGLLAPELSSIEEYLGEHTADYYAVLEQVQGGSYQPQRSARAWIEFCVEAHLAQARRRLQQLDAAARRWDALEAIVAQRGWPERLVIALEQSLFGSTDRAVYGTEAEISAATATADLRRLVDAGLLVQRGRGRNVHYRASDVLRDRIDGD